MMAPAIQTRTEGKRGCGYRKPGGLYLVNFGTPINCQILPLPLEVCPCCGEGIKFSRGYTWINPSLLFKTDCGNCKHGKGRDCFPLETKAGLLWVGKKFYGRTQDFMNEANEMGISRRIAAVPHGFKVGETWILLAHKEAIAGEHPGIFTAFVPQAIEYIIKGTETDEDLEAIEKRGITLVRIQKQQPNFLDDEDEHSETS